MKPSFHRAFGRCDSKLVDDIHCLGNSILCENLRYYSAYKTLISLSLFLRRHILWLAINALFQVFEELCHNSSTHEFPHYFPISRKYIAREPAFMQVQDRVVVAFIGIVHADFDCFHLFYPHFILLNQKMKLLFHAHQN